MMQDQSEEADSTIKHLNNSSIQSPVSDGIGSLTKQSSLPGEEGSSGGGGSGSSSPEPPEPWTPRYTVSFSDKVVKNGATVTFTIMVGQDSLTIQVLERVYEDFEYLEHCVATDQPSDGLILPPLPTRPTTDAAVTETHSKKQMGKGSKTLLGDNFQKDRLQLQKYLELLLAHPVLGRSQRLDSFLTVKEAPPRAKIKRGLLWKLSDSFETRRTAVPDCEEFFQRERAWLTKALPLVIEFDTALHGLIFAHQRLLVALEGVVTALRLTAGPASTKRRSGDTTALTTTTARVGLALEAVRCEGETTSKECDSVVGGGVELWRRHLEAEGAMLQRRTTLLLNYQHCNRALDRAKPNRRQAAEAAKKEAEEAFEACSDVARHEIKRLHRVRDSELTTLYYHYGRLQLDAATRQHATLAATLASIKGGQIG